MAIITKVCNLPWLMITFHSLTVGLVLAVLASLVCTVLLISSSDHDSYVKYIGLTGQFLAISIILFIYRCLWAITVCVGKP